MDEIHVTHKGCYLLKLLVCMNLLSLDSKSMTALLEMESVCQLIIL